MFEIYNVDEGEGLGDIALKFNSTEEELCRINGFDEDKILDNGMQIIVPVIDNSPYFYYTVKKGDNVYNIADLYKVDYKILLGLNGLDEGDYIYPNQTIIVPKDNVNVYITVDGDTLGNVIKKFDADVVSVIKQNANIYLKPEQIIIFRGK